MRSTNYKTSCWIDKIFGVFINHICRDDGIKYIFFNIFMNLFLCYFRVMLGRKNNRI